ncbi:MULTISPECIES: plasmid replication protein (RepB family) [Lactobacillaceae]|jgi:predicted  nucleic acid-binding Zn-ribbon protein|uniref:Plasmid replication protein (RepB family) n=1 Tax=Lacticaseibacillus paracasei TaxID=1597 RepID=R9WVX1_LACPA|nr:plasmid replication protein (RepB family) [Lacticaseibacillus paracasei]GEK41076.1 hypothetical protein LCA02_27660 [Lacticaseibacillus casei]AGO03652.1 plasmid replication protein (RepB family) [Lacticaseibacillus paracasei]AYG24558.1 plasmid replication protein (RepB family) [Lacticaseibacillus paracasei]AYG24565.1 plasmid replication protein (RepB family) [Lacticaseibacillus paracasei]MCT3339152.1 plasmid replication protein (RepB family) [Lacticaseibacillus paracasei]
MSKTVKELADELGVSRQRVQQIISKQVASKRPEKVAGQYVISPADESLIKRDIVGISHAKVQANSKQLSDKLQASLQEEVATLKEQIHTKDRQIQAKDNQLEKMQKLLDQSQQLQLMAENKLKKLEAPHNEPESSSESESDQIHKRAPEKSGVAENVPERSSSFWSRLFGSYK